MVLVKFFGNQIGVLNKPNGAWPCYIRKRKTNHSRSSKNHSTMSRVYSPICASQTPSGPVGSWKAWKDPVNFRSRNCLSIFIVRYECFSGFICLRPVKSKNRKTVVAELKAYCHRKWTSYCTAK